MNAKTKTGLEILQAALLLGLLGDALLRATPWGLNVLLWISALVGVMVMLTLRRRRELWGRETITLHAALIIFAAFFVWRDSLMLQTLDVLVILTVLVALSLPALNIKTHAAGFWHYVLGAISSGLNAALAPVQLILGDIEWKTIPQRGWTKHLAAVLRGLAIAAPIILIFGSLFIAADAIFENIVKNTFNINPEILFTHAFFFAFMSWICAGYLRGTLFGSLLNNNLTAAATTAETPALNLNKTIESVVHNSSEDEFKEQAKNQFSPKNENKTASFVPEFLRLGTIEIGIILGSINLLFLSFVAVQFRYFFGGMNLVQTTVDLKLADYARRGFFELCWVAALVLPILLTAHFLLKKDSSKPEGLFRVLATINIGLLFIIMYSAVERMLLYTGTLGYGLTEMRLYPTAFMFWLALVFVWFALTVLRKQPQLFAWGALWMGLFVIAGLHVLNPDNFIVGHNIRLMQQGRQFDAYYNSQLSDDALPILANASSEMSAENQHIVQCELLRHDKARESVGLLNWNWARQIAQMKMSECRSNWSNLDCSDVKPRYYDDF